MRDIIAVIVHFLEIQKPYKIILKPQVKGAQAWHICLTRKGKLIGHKIEVTLNTGADLRDTETLIVHEFIHAWQAENGFNTDHGKEFRKMARKLEKVFGIKNLYVKTSDK